VKKEQDALTTPLRGTPRRALSIKKSKGDSVDTPRGASETRLRERTSGKRLWVHQEDLYPCSERILSTRKGGRIYFWEAQRRRGKSQGDDPIPRPTTHVEKKRLSQKKKKEDWERIQGMGGGNPAERSPGSWKR